MYVICIPKYSCLRKVQLNIQDTFVGLKCENYYDAVFGEDISSFLLFHGDTEKRTRGHLRNHMAASLVWLEQKSQWGRNGRKLT